MHQIQTNGMSRMSDHRRTTQAPSPAQAENDGVTVGRVLLTKHSNNQ